MTAAVAAPLPVRFARLVKLEHTVFALPFAYVGALLSVDGWPGFGSMGWITLAMVGARTLAMAINRLVDAEIDARNPRTAGRELPAGQLSRLQVGILCVVALGAYLLAVVNLTEVVRWLWPIPVVMFVVYPYLKRFTWLCHVWLGAALGLAPVGAWIALTGSLPWQPWALGAAVCLWVAGFDLFYALLDHEHDVAVGLTSWATRFGVGGVFAGAEPCTRARSPSSRSSEQVSPSVSGTGSASRSSARCSSTSTGSSGPTTSGASTRRSSRSTERSASRSA